MYFKFTTIWLYFRTEEYFKVNAIVRKKIRKIFYISITNSRFYIKIKSNFPVTISDI